MSINGHLVGNRTRGKMTVLVPQMFYLVFGTHTREYSRVVSAKMADIQSGQNFTKMAEIAEF